MKTLIDIAKECRIKPKTLGFRLWSAGIECTKYGVVNGRTIKHYDAAAVRRIREYLNGKPVGKVGRPRPKKGKK